MDRKLAEKYIGKLVVLNEGRGGEYICKLDNMKAEPNKPWRASLSIRGVLTYPEINKNDLTLVEPLFKDKEKYESSGQKIQAFDQVFNMTYSESVNLALKKMWDKLHQENHDNEVVLAQIQQKLRKKRAESILFEDSYIYYKLVKNGRDIQIYDEEKREALSIKGFPFEFEIIINNQWQDAIYVSDLTFELDNEELVELDHGATVRLNKMQFDPYQILLNELEEPALIALEKGLKNLGIFHENLIYCHNSLLIQLLSPSVSNEFSGVNFISYSNATNQFIVQHHYERVLTDDDDDDITFDRFEFTSDSGERLLTAYATQASNE